LACEGWARLGKIPPAAVEEIKNRARFDVQRIAEIEAVTRHDVLAFTTCVAEYVGDASKYIHLGMTSSDVLDSALALQLREAAEIILEKLAQLKDILARRAREHKYTLMVGRTHGIHAEPVTFGLKMALWYTETERNIERLEQAKTAISVGKISGAVGTFANIDPQVEEYVCAQLGLKPAGVFYPDYSARSTRAVYDHAGGYRQFLRKRLPRRFAICSGRISVEAEEMFAAGQKGSSAMPHKRNPINPGTGGRISQSDSGQLAGRAGRRSLMA